MNIFGEINCYGQCLRSWAPIVAFIVIISITSIAASLMLKNPKKRLQTFVFAQIYGSYRGSLNILSHELQ